MKFTKTITDPEKLEIGDMVYVPEKPGSAKLELRIVAFAFRETPETEIWLRKTDARTELVSFKYPLSELVGKPMLDVRKLISDRSASVFPKGGRYVGEKPKGKKFFTEWAKLGKSYLRPGQFEGENWGKIYLVDDL